MFRPILCLFLSGALLLLGNSGCKTQTETVATGQEPVQAATNSSGFPRSWQLVMERTPCYGTCPIYTVTIDARTGEVDFKGRRFVELEGHYRKTISEAQLRKLWQQLNDSNFWEMKPKYDDPRVSDVPNRIIQFRNLEPGTDKPEQKVVGRYQTPQAFDDLAHLIDQIARDTEGYQKVGE